jgi:hypothetical protein
VTGLEGASLRFCHRGRLLALLFYIAPYKESVCNEDGAGKKGERHPHRKNPSHRNNQPKKYWVASLTLIHAIVATRTLPANTRSSKRAHRGLFQRANGGGPFRQILADSSINLVARSMGAASEGRGICDEPSFAIVWKIVGRQSRATLCLLFFLSKHACKHFLDNLAYCSIEIRNGYLIAAATRAQIKTARL